MPDLPTRADDGHGFTTRWFPAAEPRAGLLFLPALGVPAEKYARFGAALAARGISLAVPEWRGQASSTLRPSRRCDWGYPELVERDVAAAAAITRAQAPGVPWWIGGHSLGGQIAVLHAALDPVAWSGLALVATGVPDWRLYGHRRYGVRLFAAAIPLLTRLFGYFPGQTLRWAGTEAATLMRHWASSVRHGDYTQVGIRDIGVRLAALDCPAVALTFEHDWLVTPASIEALLALRGGGETQREAFDAARLGDTPDHFRWMKAPDAPAATIAAALTQSR
jgi:predicted alpha/beta hydrolase